MPGHEVEREEELLPPFLFSPKLDGSEDTAATFRTPGAQRSLVHFRDVVCIHIEVIRRNRRCQLPPIPRLSRFAG